MHFLPANAQHIGDRHSQQDSFGFGDPDDRAFTSHGGFLALVCDGMGGMEFGDAASRAAAHAFLDAYKIKTPAESIPAALERSTRAANDAVVTLAHQYGLSEGMGTTLVAAALVDSSLYYVSVGDSGLFLRRNGSLKMLNKPHIFANLLDAAVARGNLAPEDAENHPERESLTSFIGAESLEEIDLSADPVPLQEGDVILLASDGLFKTLSNDEMLASFRGAAQSWPEKLVEQTIGKHREHQDNVTVLTIAVERDQAQSVQVPSRVAQNGAPTVAANPPAANPQVNTTPKKSVMPWVVFLFLFVLAAGAGWWFFFGHGPVTRLNASPTGPDSSPPVGAPPRARPADIKLDPEAPRSPAQKEPGR